VVPSGWIGPMGRSHNTKQLPMGASEVGRLACHVHASCPHSAGQPGLARAGSNFGCESPPSEIHVLKVMMLN